MHATTESALQAGTIHERLCGADTRHAAGVVGWTMASRFHKPRRNLRVAFWSSLSPYASWPRNQLPQLRCLPFRRADRAVWLVAICLWRGAWPVGNPQVGRAAAG